MITPEEAYKIFSKENIKPFSYNGIKESEENYIFETYNFNKNEDAIFTNIGNPIIAINKKTGKVSYLYYLDDYKEINSAKKINDPIFE